MADVRLIYEGTDITNDVDVTKCVCDDVSGGSDCVHLTLDNAENWLRWGPQMNDEIRVQLDNYDSGLMYMNTVVSENGRFQILATSMKCGLKRVADVSYAEKTLLQILSLNAAECEMGANIYGLDGATRFDYLIRERETAPVFMARLAQSEGAILKAVNGNFALIGIGYAQELDAIDAITPNDVDGGIRYTGRPDARWSSVRIISPLCSASATDSAASGVIQRLSNLSVTTDAQAKRWAIGELLSHNRQAETIEYKIDFNPAYTAAARVVVSAEDNIGGSWIIEKVRHDLTENKSSVKLLRCVYTVQ